MRIIARSNLVDFWRIHPEAEGPLSRWIVLTAAAHWQSPADVQATFPKAKALNGERIRFEIAGGNYRLIAAFDWRRQIAFVKFVGTHRDYDQIDALTVSIF